MANSLLNLDNTLVQNNEALLTQLLSEAYPTYNLSKGSVLNKTQIRPNALLSAEIDNRIQALSDSINISTITGAEDPNALSTEVVDAVFSNYQITRRQATFASGNLVIVLSANVSTFISPDLTFSAAGGVAVRPTGPFAGITDPSLKTSTKERVISSIGDGLYAFTVPVQARSAGSSGDVAARTAFSASQTIPYVVSIYAEADFSGGSDQETNEEMIARVGSSIAPDAPANRRSYTKIIQDTFPIVSDVSIIGAGDKEMVRDKHNIFGLSTYGKIDAYVRTAALPTLAKVRKTGLRSPSDPDLVKISFAADINDFPGFYRVEHILPVDNPPFVGSYEITDDYRGVDPDAVPSSSPFFGSTQEAVYSAYQTAVITFRDPAAPTKQDSELEYDVYVRYMPAIYDVQSFLGGKELTDPGADIVTRAPIPCFLSTDVTVYYVDGKINPDEAFTSALKNAVSSAVNKVPFSITTLATSVVTDAINPFLGSSGYVDLPLKLRGRLLAPDGSEVIIANNDVLHIPTNITRGYSRRITAFYMFPESVSITYKAIE